MALQENWVYAPPATRADELGDFDYLETKDSGKETYSPDSSQASRTFLVPWSSRGLFVDDLLGYSFITDLGTISRVLPDEHPDIDNFYASDCTVEGIGELGKEEDRDALTWTLAKVVANYKPRSYAVLDDDEIGGNEMNRFVTRTYTYGADYLSLNGRMLFVSNQIILNNPPGRITTSIELTYTWEMVPTFPNAPFIVPNINAVECCIGKVNSEYFDGRPPGTCLFIGIDPKMVTGKKIGDVPTYTLGNYYWQIQMKVLYRNNGFVTVEQGSTVVGPSLPGPSISEFAGHNFIFNISPGVNQWDLLTSDGDINGPRIYDEADLNDLFRLDLESCMEEPSSSSSSAP